MSNRAITTRRKKKKTMSIADMWLKFKLSGTSVDALITVGAAIAIGKKTLFILLCFLVCNLVCSFLISKNSFF